MTVHVLIACMLSCASSINLDGCDKRSAIVSVTTVISSNTHISCEDWVE